MAPVEIHKPKPGHVFFLPRTKEVLTTRGLKAIFKEADDVFNPQEAEQYKKSLLKVLEEIPRNDLIDGRPHPNACKYAKVDQCNCWCNGKHHGLGKANEVEAKP